MDPDFASAVMAAVLATTTQAVVFALLWWIHRGTPGVGLWFGSVVMIVLALLLLRTRSGVWFDESAADKLGFTLSRIWLPNLMLSASPLVFLAGVRRFLGKSALARLPLLLFLCNLGAMTWFTLVTPDLPLRTFLQTVTWSGFFLIISGTLFGHRDLEVRLSTRVAGVIFLLVTCTFALRALLIFPEIHAAIPNRQILLNKHALLGTTVNCMLWTFGVCFLIQQRQTAVIARLHRRSLALEGEKCVLEHQQRLSRDLHDGVGGAVASINLLAAAASAAMPEDSPRLLTKIALLAGEANSDIRSMMNKLDHPELTRGKWLAELRVYASTLLDGAELRLKWQATGFDATLIGDALAALSLLRALKEGLHNSVRHAQARQVTLICHASTDSLAITLRDDGIGIPLAATTGRGLPSLHRRATDLGGSLRITSATPGTCLEFFIPLPLSFQSTGKI